MSHILILAALPEEAAALYSNLPGTNEEFLGFDLRCVTVRDTDIAIVTTGIGKVNAALAAGLFGVDADIILMSGTCGALDAKAGAYWIAKAVQHDYGAAQASGFQRYRAGDWPMGEPEALTFRPIKDPKLGLPHANIASGDSFVADPVAAAEIRKALDVQLVDMEVAAVAQAAEKMGKPWAAIKAVTDDANGNSSGDFRANLAHAARQAAEKIEQLVKGYCANN
jgi:adenosylhomocysteine nucleosidase